MLVQKTAELKGSKRETTMKKNKGQTEVLDNINLSGLEEWSGAEQEDAWELITEYASIFAMSDMDLGRTSLVKHSIKLTDNALFKERYQ